ERDEIAVAGALQPLGEVLAGERRRLGRPRSRRWGHGFSPFGDSGCLAARYPADRRFALRRERELPNGRWTATPLESEVPILGREAGRLDPNDPFRISSPSPMLGRRSGEELPDRGLVVE